MPAATFLRKTMIKARVRGPSLFDVYGPPTEKHLDPIFALTLRVKRRPELSEKNVHLRSCRSELVSFAFLQE